MQSPLGLLVVKGTDEAIIEISFADTPLATDAHVPDVLQQCLHQLHAYFEGKLTQFDIPIAPLGTSFQVQVWEMLLQIGYASTSTYAELSRLLGDDKKARAVGNATGKNPLAIVVPCHRLVGSDNSLTGYAGGLWRKQWLLDHEAEHGRGIKKLF
jgi:methylated-DNA-[protein]-cysteine S-methyltransferase